MEQIMSTGGGWQDQVGGASAGIKMVSADKALKQKIICTPLRIDNGTLRELSERFALIYTGQRRLARNLLRDIVGKYVGGDPDVNEVSSPRTADPPCSCGLSLKKAGSTAWRSS